MILLIFILIYILSVLGLLLIIYTMDTSCKTIGDVLDESEFFMYIPFVNNIALIAGIIAIIIFVLINSLKLDKFWDKIRNIKLR